MGGFSFGKPAEKPAESTPAVGFSFGKPADKPASGTSTGGFSFGKLADKPAENAPSTGGFSFGKPADKPAENAPSAGGFLFGKPAEKPAENAPSTGGFSFGKPADKPAENAPSGGFSFGKPADKNNDKPADKPAGGFSFGKPAESDKPTDKPAAGTATSGFSFGKPANTAAEKPAGPAGGPSLGKPAENKQSTSTTTAAPSLLRGKNVQEIVTMWQEELDASVKDFGRQAGEIAAWDRVLLKGGDEMSRLLTNISKAEERQGGIEQTLDYVEQQQTELNTLLDSYENQMGDMLQSGVGSGLGAKGSSADAGAADSEREKSYALAERLNAQLDDMSRSLGSMIDEVNGLSAPRGRDGAWEDPITQISAILNAHLGSLKWIDESAVQLRDRLEALRRGQTGRMPGGSLRASSIEPRRESSVGSGRFGL
jgi:nuclear pore complex protein Nup62